MVARLLLGAAGVLVVLALAPAAHAGPTNVPAPRVVLARAEAVFHGSPFRAPVDNLLARLKMFKWLISCTERASGGNS